MGRALAALLLLAVLAPARLAAGDAALAVIVHPSRRDAPGPEDVARIFLGRQRFWSDGSAIVPLNQPAGTPLRERFSERVLGQGSARLADYWNAQYFQGVLPPAVLASSDAVKRYVATEPRAVGYVAVHDVDETVHVVLRLD